MRRLCFGGSFNPIHHGHLICARHLAEVGGFQRVVLIPSGQPPHKPHATDLALPEHRLAMCRLAAASEPELFGVEDLELTRLGPSYTIDTAHDLQTRGWGKVHWLIGADMLAILPQWHQAQALLETVEFVVMARPGWTMDWSALPAPFRKLRHNVLEAPLIQISATDLRQRVAQGRSIAFLTPPPVVEYIQLHRLYQPAVA